MKSGVDLRIVIPIAIVYVATQWFVLLYPSYDLTTFILGAAVPFAFSVILPLSTRNRTLLYALLAYFWALVEDGPVYLDSIFTWPEITRFNPAGPHIFLEVLYHLLTAFFLILAIREATKGKSLGARKVIIVTSLTLVALILAYAQNLPLSWIQAIIESQWYAFSIVEHTLSAIAFYLALRETIV